MKMNLQLPAVHLNVSENKFYSYNVSGKFPVKLLAIVPLIQKLSLWETVLKTFYFLSCCPRIKGIKA